MDERLWLLERELAQLRGEVARLKRRSRGRWRVLLAAVAIAALALTPLGALAANFGDLNPGSPHNANINAIADAGISLGCNPSGTLYCPNQLVTREQMASFLARTAGLGTNPPIANAATAQNSDRVDGWHAHELARLGASGSGTTVYIVGGLYGTVAAVGVIAPAPGYVVLTATVRLTSASTSLNRVCARLYDPATVLQSLEQCVAIGTYTGTLAEGQLAVQTVFLVPSPGAYAYSFDVAKDTMVSFGTAYADNATVFARYTPFGPSGLLPSEVATAEQGAALPVIPARDLPPADPALYPKP